MRPLLALLIACSGSPDKDSATPTGTTPPTSGEGTLALTFRMDADQMTNMQEPAIGTFYGSFWRGSEVSSLGPDDGAEDLGGIEVTGIDLTVGGGPTGVLFVSGPLPAEEVVVLGFLDTDGNADPNDLGPDSKDPVTLPNDNDFDVVGDAETTVEVYFGLLNP